MRLLNLGCGAVRPGDPWTNLDCLRRILPEGTIERTGLDSESNYVEHIIGSSQLPFEADTFDGCLLSHVVEHFDCREAVDLISDCRRILKPLGVLVVSVPDARIFLDNFDRDKPGKAVEIYGEVGDPTTSFFNAALFFVEHKQVLTISSLKCLAVRAGFSPLSITNLFGRKPQNATEPVDLIMQIMNRRNFSVEIACLK